MYPQYQPAQYQPLFRVRVVKHTGLMMMWLHQSYTVTGTYTQCEEAIRSAQQYNLAAGWWSPLSALLLNWIALAINASARKELQHNAAQAHAAAHRTHTAPQYGAPPPTRPSAG